MGFRNIGALADAVTNGQGTTFTWRKTVSQTTVQGLWTDLAYVPGNPVPIYYASSPYIGTPISSSDGGLYVGGAVSPATKHLKTITVFSASSVTPAEFVLCDYLYYYPFIDQSITDPQILDSTAPMTRYSNGAGVQMIAVLTNSQTGGQSFTVTYTNSAGQSRTTPAVTCNTGTSGGTLINTAPATQGCAGCFIPLAVGDTGVRSVQSVTMLGADIGLFTLVLVKPLANFMLRGTDAPVEVDFVRDRPSVPCILDNAFLNLLCLPSVNLAGLPIHGLIETVWN